MERSRNILDEGRPPTLKKLGADWEYIQAIKERDEHGKGVKILCVFGNRAENASTAYIERSNLPVLCSMHARCERRWLERCGDESSSRDRGGQLLQLGTCT